MKILAIKRWFPFNFAKTFCGGWNKKLQTFIRHLFLEQPSKCCIAEFTAIFVCLLLSWSRRYSTSTTRNFYNNWPTYLNFSNMINLCPNIWFIKNSKCQQFVFWKRSRQKTQIFHIFKGPIFHNGWPYWYEFWRILRDSCRLSKTCGFETFPEI